MKLVQHVMMFFSALLLMSACQIDADKNVKDIPPKSMLSDEKIALEVNLPTLKTSTAIISDVRNHELTTSTTDSSIKVKAEKMYLALSAELYNRLEAPVQSAHFYQKLVENSDDVALAKRATILAAINNQSERALLNAQKWVDLDANNLEANQYLALLLLRNDKDEESAAQLNRIEFLVAESETQDEKESFKSLRFIGALLSVESHHDKALRVFIAYLKNKSIKGGDTESLAKIQVQQQLILASLANQAENHDVVIASLAQLDSYVSDDAIEPKSYIKASLMKAKALKSVKRVADAVQILKPVVDEHDASDSIKLELVRLLIMNQQKDSAFTYLKDLTLKHPQNNDLLKSLIALQIDQANYRDAAKDIERLKRSADYASDADYFMAEIFEAQGDTTSALESYMKVTSGALLKNAQKKVVRLNKLLSLEAKPRTVNYKK
ncbi:MAG TPA: hypothetical protein EYG71_06705 [Leucothrix sp.]|nr:hypothetical protein [Leucothrix sp.]